MPKVPLHTLTAGHEGGIYNGPKFSRLYVNDPAYGVPFLGSTDMLEADFSWLPLLHKRIAQKFPYLEVEPGMTLISCSGTIGRMAYVRPDMAGFWSSQHVMKVNPDCDRILPGYLHAFLQSKFGVPIVVSSAYGAIIQHIEPHHIADLPVPRFGEQIERRIHELIQEAADLRARFQAGVDLATRDLFESAGLSDIVDVRWHAQPRDLGFVAPAIPTSLRALNFSPRAQRILDRLRSVQYVSLGEVCRGGMLRTGARFKRIDSDPAYGVRLVGQRQAFWLRPEGRWINPGLAPPDIMQKDETVLIAAHGTLGENEVYGRSILVTGSWLRNAFSQDFVRVLSGYAEVSGAYLFALLRSDAAFRVLRAMSVGGKQQEYHSTLLREFPVPLCTREDRERIAETVRQAYRWRDEADMKEDQALTLLDEAVREAAG
ncbi:MAG: restriction endonuclease subunit S [Thermobispora bispora]|nr:restriction endonuclease subunit S [Thermobispora bispora]